MCVVCDGAELGQEFNAALVGVIAVHMNKHLTGPDETPKALVSVVVPLLGHMGAAIEMLVACTPPEARGLMLEKIQAAADVIKRVNSLVPAGTSKLDFGLAMVDLNDAKKSSGETH